MGISGNFFLIFYADCIYVKYSIYSIKFKDAFQEPPILTFRRNGNLYDLLGCKNIVYGKLQRLSKKKKIEFFY